MNRRPARHKGGRQAKAAEVMVDAQERCRANRANVCSMPVQDWVVPVSGGQSIDDFRLSADVGPTCGLIRFLTVARAPDAASVPA